MISDVDNGLDVMQVCRNGHVITERLRSDPESGRTHCDRCGAVTLDHCLTCGQELAGAGRVHDLVTIGTVPAPRYCPTCGAAFPWVRRPRPAPEPLGQLDHLLRRLPLVIRQLRWRQGERPAFRVEDQRDLEDLVRALLPVYFEEVRPESRTPRYSAGTRADFVLAREKIAVTLKFVRAGVSEQQLAEQWREDIAYYRQRGGCRVIIGFVYDPEGLTAAQQPVLDNMGAELREEMEVRWVVVG
jgi:hypothetical protein